VTDVRLSPLRYIDAHIEGRHCKGLVDSGAEIGLLSEELAREINTDECGHICERGIFSDPLHVPLVSVTVKCDGETTMIMWPMGCKLRAPLLY